MPNTAQLSRCPSTSLLHSGIYCCLAHHLCYVLQHINYERHLRKGVEDRLAAYCYEQQQAEATRQRNATLRAKAETDRVDALVESRDRLQLKLLEVQAEQQKTEEENLQLKVSDVSITGVAPAPAAAQNSFHD